MKHVTYSFLNMRDPALSIPSSSILEDTMNIPTSLQSKSIISIYAGHWHGGQHSNIFKLLWSLFFEIRIKKIEDVVFLHFWRQMYSKTKNPLLLEYLIFLIIPNSNAYKMYNFKNTQLKNHPKIPQKIYVNFCSTNFSWGFFVFYGVFCLSPTRRPDRSSCHLARRPPWPVRPDGPTVDLEVRAWKLTDTWELTTYHPGRLHSGCS